MKENIELILHLEGNATTVGEMAIMLGTAQKEEEGLIQEEDIIAKEGIEVDLEVITTEEGIQDLEVPDQEVIEKEVIEDIKDIKAEVEAEEVEVVAFQEEVEIRREREKEKEKETVKEVEINLVEVRIVPIEVKNQVEVNLVN